MTTTRTNYLYAVHQCSKAKWPEAEEKSEQRQGHIVFGRGLVASCAHKAVHILSKQSLHPEEILQIDNRNLLAAILSWLLFWHLSVMLNCYIFMVSCYILAFMALISGGTQSQENNKFKHSFSKEYQNSYWCLARLSVWGLWLFVKSLNQQPQFQLASIHMHACVRIHLCGLCWVLFITRFLSQGFMVGWLSLSSWTRQANNLIRHALS